MITELELKIWMAGIAAVAFGVVYWWRRRTRGANLDLSAGSQRLTELVEKADKPEAEDVAEGIARGIKDL